MGVQDQAQFSWIDAEVALLRQAIKRRLPVLGICLGAQLLAVAAGAGVRRNPEREIGCFPVQWTPEAQRHPLTSFLPETLDVVHWHGDTFALPPGAIRLARSQACLNQAFALHRALGLQFHLEMGPEEVAAVAAHCPGDLATGPFVQTLPDILAQERVFNGCRSALFDLMDLWSRP
jgi:GMP synthase-like glutamine amidotransferase